jgi:hypothetical protein
VNRLLVLFVSVFLVQTSFAEEYPTLERVDHVITCMARHGGQTIDNLYACSCEIDVIAKSVSLEDFTEARTFEIYKRMPGEKGGLFRNSERGDEIVALLDGARAEAEKQCFIGKKKSSTGTAPMRMN